MARALILAALLLVPPLFLGVWEALRERKRLDVPLLITGVAIFGAHWIFVQIAPFISSQDFRYSVLLLVPLTVFCIQGGKGLPAKWAEFFHFAFQFAILNCALYVLELALAG